MYHNDPAPVISQQQHRNQQKRPPPQTLPLNATMGRLDHCQASNASYHKPAGIHDVAPVQLRTNRVATFSGRPVSAPMSSFAKQRSLPSTSLRGPAPINSHATCAAIPASTASHTTSTLPSSTLIPTKSVPYEPERMLDPELINSNHPSSLIQTPLTQNHHQPLSTPVSMTPVRVPGPIRAPTTTSTSSSIVTSSIDHCISHNPHFIGNQKSQKLVSH